MNKEQLMCAIRTPCKTNELLLAPSFKKGEFDSHGVDCPFPFRHDGRWWMTYIGWDGLGYQTGLAVSDDLRTWSKEGVILGRGPKGSTTEFNVAMTSILRDNDLFGTAALIPVDGRFVGTYHAYPDAGYEAGPASIGLCYSKDLRHWEVSEPVLRPDPSCEWEAGGLYKSWLMTHQNTYYLFYNAKTKSSGPWLERTGVAMSQDLVNWTRYVGNPILGVGLQGAFDDRFASDPCVFRHGEAWLMFYFGLSSDGHARESVAFSKDLLHWQKTDEVLVDVGPAGSVDSQYAHKPGMITNDGKLYHFYCAVAGFSNTNIGEIVTNQRRGISLATSY